MAIEQAVEYVNVAAGQDLSSASLSNTGVLHKAVTFNGTIASGPVLCIGLLKSKAPNGGNVRVAVEGWAKAWIGSGGVTTPGYPLTVVASGFLAVCNSGSTMVARATGAASSGDLSPVQLLNGPVPYNG